MEGIKESWPSAESSIWNNSSLAVVMGFRSGKTKWRRPPIKMKGWKFRWWPVSHDAIGGVTNAVVVIWAIIRDALDASSFIPGLVAVPAQLADVLDKTGSGRPLTTRPGDKPTASATRLLVWENRFQKVVCTSVFHPGKLIQRSLSAKELALAMDLPNARVKAYKGDLNALVRRVEVPGKFVQAAVGSFVTMITDRKSNKTVGIGEIGTATESSGTVRSGEGGASGATHCRKGEITGRNGEGIANVVAGAKESLLATDNRNPNTNGIYVTVNEHDDNKPEDDRPEETGVERNGDTSPTAMAQEPDQPHTRITADISKAPLTEAYHKSRLDTVLRQNTPDPTLSDATSDDRATDEPKSTVTSKAVKSDDAAAPVHLWDDFILQDVDSSILASQGPAIKRSFDLLRELELKVWKRKVKLDFEEWFATSVPEHFDRDLVRRKGEEAIEKANGASFWTWDKGSSPFFWRWDEEYMEDVLSGGPVRFDKVPQPWFQKARAQGTEDSRLLMRKKLEKFLDKGYVKLVGRDEITSLLNVFAVPKGQDIRPVFDGTKSGLNDCLWTPWFHLPGADSLTNELLPGYWNADNDYGEQFLNFPLNPQLMRYCGVDLTPYFPELSSDEIVEVIGVWWRNLMGLQCSPYLSVQGAQRAKRVILGDRFDPNNPFQWARVDLNLPGDESYDPTLPRVMRVRADGDLATALHQFVDDLRTTASEQKRAWVASTRIGKTLSWLGLQDAPRKRREPSQEPGAWAGVVVSTIGGTVKKFVSDERWVKTRERIRWFAYMLFVVGVEPPLDSDWSKVRAATPKGSLLFETAERYVGFLRYVAQTYKSMVPYLKGIYLTLNNWRQHRDSDGWKLGTKAIEEAMRAEDFEHAHRRPAKAPKFVRIVRRLRSDVSALMRLTAAAEAPKVNVRPVSCVVAYLIGDASGSGFGVALWIPGQKPIRFSHGVWDAENSAQSSNFRESANLILKLREYLEAGAIPRGAELFIFTDNSCAENAYHNGSSSVRHLHELALQLRELEMAGDLHVRAIWIAGTRMIQTGVDGLSRGDLANGVLSGDMSFLAPLPLNLSVFDRVPAVRQWLHESLAGMALPWKELSKEGWFDDAFKDPMGAYIWCPPAAAAEPVINSLCDVKHVHPETSHIVILSCMETQPWRRTLSRLSDCVVELKPDSPLWGPEQHESLIIAFVSPFLISPPFAVKRTRWVRHWEKELSSVWNSDPAAAGDCVRQFWGRAWCQSTLLQRGLSRKVLRSAARR